MGSATTDTVRRIVTTPRIYPAPIDYTVAYADSSNTNQVPPESSLPAKQRPGQHRRRRRYVAGRRGIFRTSRRCLSVWQISRRFAAGQSRRSRIAAKPESARANVAVAVRLGTISRRRRSSTRRLGPWSARRLGKSIRLLRRAFALYHPVAVAWKSS